MTVFTLSNQKGGVGKTTTCALLCDFFQTLPNKKILLIDLDPQGSLTETYLSDLPENTLLHFFSKVKTLKQCITKINDNVDILAPHPSMIDLPNIDSTKLPTFKNSFISVMKDYDYVIVDTKPALDWLFRLGIYLANYIIMPNIMSAYSYQSLARAQGEIQENRTPDLKRVLVFENMGRRQSLNVKEKYRKDFKEELGEDFLDIKLNQLTEIDERSAKHINYFKSGAPYVEETRSFFNTIMKEVSNG